MSGVFEVRHWVPGEFLTLEASIRHSDGFEEWPFECFSNAITAFGGVAERYDDPDVGRHPFEIEFCRRSEAFRDTVASVLHVRLTSRFSGVVSKTTIVIPPFPQGMFTNPRYRVAELRDLSIDPDRDGHPNGLEITGRILSDCEESVELAAFFNGDLFEQPLRVQPPSTPFRLKVDGRLLRSLAAGQALHYQLRVYPQRVITGHSGDLVAGQFRETDLYRWSDFEALDPDSAR